MLSNLSFYDISNKCYEINQKRFDLIQSKKYENIPIILVGRYASYLIGENDHERTTLKESKPLVYFDNNQNKPVDILFASFEKNLKQTICQISKSNPMYVLQPIPELGFNAPKRIAKNLAYGNALPTSISYSSYLGRSQKIREIIEKTADECGAIILDPAKFLCKTGECISEYKGRPIYRDGDHLSEYGNKLLIPMFKQALQ